MFISFRNIGWEIYMNLFEGTLSIKLLIGIVLGAVLGLIINFISFRVINNDEERKKDFKKSKFILIAMVLITTAIVFKYNSIHSFNYVVATFFLVLIALIDKYTMYVYNFIANIGILSSLIVALISSDLKFLYTVPIIIIFFIVAKKGYIGMGDVRTIVIIGFSTGPMELAIIIILSFIIALVFNIKTKDHQEFPMCPFFATAYLIAIILL